MCSKVVFIFYFIFFFQAEDGIRDKLVTGVQTCALPIFTFAPRNWLSRSCRAGLAVMSTWKLRRVLAIGSWLGYVTAVTRSEERRVGKECRSRRSPYR